MASLFAMNQDNQNDQEKKDSLFYTPGYFGGEARKEPVRNERPKEREFRLNQQATIYNSIRKTVDDCILTSTMHGLPKVISIFETN